MENPPEATKEKTPASASSGTKAREGVLLELGKSLRTISIYPSGHPQRGRLLEAACASVQQSLAALGHLEFDVSRSGFVCGGERLGENQPLIKELAKEMHLRQVKSFALRRELTLSDLTSFLELLLQDPEKFRQGGFIENWIKTRELKTVWINEIDFSKAVSAARLESEEVREEKTEPDQAARVRELIELMEHENDPERFDALLRELAVLVQAMIEAGLFEPALRILRAVSFHAAEGARRGPAGEQIRALVARTLRSLLQGKFLAWSLEFYSLKEKRDQAGLDRMFLLLGRALTEPAMKILAGSESMTAHRPLMDLILKLGDKARPELEELLGSENPVLVRKALHLLGELQSRASVEKIKPFISHREDKVRREAIRALVRIPGVEASRALAAALQKETDYEVKAQIASALGERKESSAVSALSALIKSTPVREETAGLLEAAAEALGKIGSREALPVLISLLNKKSFFRKEPALRARTAAAFALGRLGGESAMQALARYARKPKTPFEQLCTEVLEALVENDGKPVQNLEERVKWPR